MASDPFHLLAIHSYFGGTTSRPFRNGKYHSLIEIVLAINLIPILFQLLILTQLGKRLIPVKGIFRLAIYDRCPSKGPTSGEMFVNLIFELSGRRSTNNFESHMSSFVRGKFAPAACPIRRNTCDHGRQLLTPLSFVPIIIG